MAPYRQTCICQGRAISAIRDADRYQREAQDIAFEIALLERQRVRATSKARIARLRLLDEPPGPCSVCGGSGVVVSRGEVHDDRSFQAQDWNEAESVG
jgi:hypothetical protein